MPKILYPRENLTDPTLLRFRVPLKLYNDDEMRYEQKHENLKVNNPDLFKKLSKHSPEVA
jgi:hypothetical protein